MDRRTGDAVQEEQETAGGGDAAPAKEAAAPAVSGEPASPVKGNGGNDDHGGEVEEDEGYRTPTSPRHRLRAPEVCPPAPRTRPVLLTAPRGGKRGRPDRGAGVGWLSDGVLTWVWVGADDLLPAFCRRRRVGAGRPGGNVHVQW